MSTIDSVATDWQKHNVVRITDRENLPAGLSASDEGILDLGGYSLTALNSTLNEPWTLENTLVLVNNDNPDTFILDPIEPTNVRSDYIFVFHSDSSQHIEVKVRDGNVDKLRRDVNVATGRELAVASLGNFQELQEFYAPQTLTDDEIQTVAPPLLPQIEIVPVRDDLFESIEKQ